MNNKIDDKNKEQKNIVCHTTNAIRIKIKNKKIMNFMICVCHITYNIFGSLYKKKNF